jgi:hypothetical protein
MKPSRLMPEHVQLGHHANTVMGHAIYQRDHWKDPDNDDLRGRRKIMGFIIPDWQRPLVWTEAQQIRFIESAWKGLPLGTYTYNQVFSHPEYDHLLIDGQQRMWSLDRYLNNEFKVFGYYWSELTIVDHRVFEMSTLFPCYVTKSADEGYLKDYYNLMNFGGTTHTEDQRA